MTKGTGIVWCGELFDIVALPADDTDELPALACLAKPVMSDLMRECCVEFNEGGPAVKLLADLWCDRVPCCMGGAW